ncbi:uncharacterized protein EI90DRAFT_3069166 [Cantharellus anzutake]|uniref:uncharacterized protein n=1 Tax=Cantharellus anzutake TaxID=1750568 RepID=UPI0019038A64|nr:uncharacterized protein EI90DRAFT_3078611 [Cantharellus anzutake]XP_038913147.1 uncharacterized protein EI90DRAFT_3069166 [Cantharellus anzutake]KAF8321946.1 hypothetical protein EI90DRAFT_3078611 [Cantharellus anzutake]KAF8326817.1 hypothetical protein EI90DRAFT_3069166 [Cantharellus anzutake]
MSLDGELGRRIAQKNAIVMFDDYDRKTQPAESCHHPRRGIDAFMAVHEGEYEALHSGYQSKTESAFCPRTPTVKLERICVQHQLGDNEYAILVTVTLHTAVADDTLG